VFSDVKLLMLFEVVPNYFLGSGPKINIQFEYPSSKTPRDLYFISLKFDINTDFSVLLNLSSDDILIQCANLSSLIDDIVTKGDKLL
jgi:hypothetical protein